MEFIYNAAILTAKNYKKDEIMQKSIFLNKPNLVVSATDHSTLDAICKTKDTNTFDIVEIRLDQLVQEKNLKEKISSISHPLLLTCRHPKEGGQNNISDPLKRISLIEPLLPFASAIDIELSEFDKMKNIVSEAKSKGIKIILSYHNFKTTPETSDLNLIISEAEGLDVDIIKIATTTNALKELIDLLRIKKNSKIENLSFMGMGNFGMASRLIAAQSGSILNYTAIGETTIKGQWQLEEFLSALNSN